MNDRARQIGTQLRVDHQLCNRYKHDPDKALYCVMGGWLRKQFIEKHKDRSPTWRALVDAVKSPVGGSSRAGAQRIEENYEGGLHEQYDSYNYWGSVHSGHIFPFSSAFSVRSRAGLRD